jgi:hypothetical protein
MRPPERRSAPAKAPPAILFVTNFIVASSISRLIQWRPTVLVLLETVEEGFTRRFGTHAE